MSGFSKLQLYLLAFVQWALVLPAGVFLVAGVLRSLQPQQYEPARTSEAIVQWAVQNLPGVRANIVLLALPALVALAGGAMLLSRWRADEDMRREAIEAASTVWRYRTLVLIGAATAMALAVMAVVIGRHIADLPQ